MIMLLIIVRHTGNDLPSCLHTRKRTDDFFAVDWNCEYDAGATLSAHFLGVSGVPVVTNVTADAGQAGSEYSSLHSFECCVRAAVESIIKSAPVSTFFNFLSSPFWFGTCSLTVVASRRRVQVPRPRDHQDAVNAFYRSPQFDIHTPFTSIIFLPA